MRVTRTDVDGISQQLINSFGSLDAETTQGQLITHPPGTTIPTEPGRVPAGKVPKTRAPIGLLHVLVQAACGLFNPNPGGFVDRYLDFSEYTSSRGVADGLMRTLCGAPPTPSGEPPTVSPTPPPPQTPFSGGQCVCDNYRVRVRFQDGSSGSDVIRTESNLKGPIISVNKVPLRNGAGEIVAFEAEVVHGSEECGGVQVRRYDNGIPTVDNSGTATIVEIINLTNPGEQCGDPEPEAPDVPDAPIPPTIPPSTFDPGDGGPPIVYRPEFGIDIGIGGPTLNIGVDFGDTGDIDIEFNVDIGGTEIIYPTVPARCCPPGALQPQPPDVAPNPRTPRPVNPPGVPPDDEDGDEPTTVFRAVIVTASNIDTPATAIFAADGGPTVYAPRLGTLQFKIAAAGDVTGWTEDIDIKNGNQYIEVPAQQGAVNVKVFPFGTTQFSVVRLYQQIDAPLGEISP